MPDVALLGKYWPGSSPLHQMDPRAKLGFALLVLVTIFCAQNWLSMGLCVIGVIACFVIARIPLAQALRSIAPLSFIIVITVLLNLFWVQGGAVLIEWWFIRISELGVYSAVFIGVRLFLLLLSMSLLTLTTTPLDITDAFDRVLHPLVRIGVPAHELSMIMGITLRFLPQFLSEFRIIRQAQISRGANPTLNPFKGGMRSLGSFSIPLFASVFRHADTLSSAMDARCYHGGTGRTRLHPLSYTYLDRNALIALIAMLVLVIIMNFIV